MGQQQLLLIILGVIVVGIAVAVGITMFSDSSINANRDALASDLVNMASRAQQFYRRPVSLGGGGNDFTKLTSIAQLTNHPTNENGTYTLISASGSGSTAKAVIKGVGTEFYNNVLVAVQVDVFPDRDSVYTLN